MKKISFILILIFAAFYSQVNGQDNDDLKKLYSSFAAGDIVTSPTGHFDYGIISLSQEAYDIHVVGVIKPNLNFSNPRLMPNPIQMEGSVKVKCNSQNGVIKKGDLVTTSSTPGVAMKSTQPGMILGIAMEDGVDGLVNIRLMIQYANPK